MIDLSPKATFRALCKCAFALRSRLKPKVETFEGNRPGNRKWALVSYLPGAINKKDGDKTLSVHSNWWECRQIARILSDRGYNVEAISYADAKTVPPRKYDLVFDIEGNLARLKPFQKPETKFLMMLTGSHLPFAVEAERKRIVDFVRRHGIPYAPRYAKYGERTGAMDTSLEVADKCLLLGNAVAESTYPSRFHGKMERCPVTIVPPSSIKTEGYGGKSFLYFFSGRNVAKGLDLVLDAAARHADWSVRVVGSIDPEFEPWIRGLSNVKIEGFLKPDSAKFAEIVADVSAFVAPTCTEGTSPAALTCMAAGLYPIVSARTGIDMPAGCGIVFDDLTPETVESCMSRFLSLPESEAARQTAACRAFVAAAHSREAFTNAVSSVLDSFERGGSLS